ncbi:uncharacterized protein [Dermacentor albipictus]|uniref:uncharacterized protein isoform X3 n=1 Tax=Dermacentor albipictus TaxID=60249 RepID=UPI0038FD10E3
MNGAIPERAFPRVNISSLLLCATCRGSFLEEEHGIGPLAKERILVLGEALVPGGRKRDPRATGAAPHPIHDTARLLAKMRFNSAIFMVAVIAAFVGMITATAERSEARSEEGRRWQGVVDETAIPPQERYKRQRVGNRAPCISSLTQYVASTWYFFPSDNKVRLVAEMKFTAAILLVALLTAFMGTITAADERNDEARTGDIYGSGCPDSSACTKSCKAKGLNLGVCLEPLLKICLCS